MPIFAGWEWTWVDCQFFVIPLIIKGPGTCVSSTSQSGTASSINSESAWGVCWPLQYLSCHTGGGETHVQRPRQWTSSQSVTVSMNGSIPRLLVVTGLHPYAGSVLRWDCECIAYVPFLEGQLTWQRRGIPFAEHHGDIFRAKSHWTSPFCRLAMS